MEPPPPRRASPSPWSHCHPDALPRSSPPWSHRPVSCTPSTPVLRDGSMSLAGWEMMIHLGFLAGTGVRIANELGAANGQGARFATIVSTTTSFFISIFISSLSLIFHDKLAVIFSSSKAVIDEVDSISVLLALTILLNGIQPVLSGVAVGSGWQALVAYVNIGSYYLIGVPFGVLLAWSFHYDVLGIWVGMIGGTTVQILILASTMWCIHLDF